eukprot:gene9500-10502_t
MPISLFWVPVTCYALLFFVAVFTFFNKVLGLDVRRTGFAVSSVHAVVAVCWTSYAAYEDPIKSAGGESTYLEAAWLATSLGYYILDSIVCILYVPDGEALLHHAACVFGQIGALVYNRCGYNLVLTMLIAEVSTPFLNAFSAEFFPKGSLGYMICQVVFAVLFLIARIVLEPFLAYDLMTSEAPFLTKTACVTLIVLSVYWAAKVISGILEFLAPKAKTVEIVEVNTAHPTS